MRRTGSLEKTDAGKDWRQKKKGTTENEIVGWHHWPNGHEFEQAREFGDGQGSLVCCSPWGCKEPDTTEQLNWTDGLFMFRTGTRARLTLLLFNMLSRLIIAFLPISKCLLISWLQSASALYHLPWFWSPRKRSVAISIVSAFICHEVMGPDAMIFVFWMLGFKPVFHSPLSLSSRGSSVPLRFLP